MKTIVAVFLTLALAVPAMAEIPVWDRPVGECTLPNGTVVTDPGNIPLPCDTLTYCIAYGIDGECVQTDEYQIPGCTAMSGTEEYLDAVSAWWVASKAFNWCVLIDYWRFIAAAVGR